MAYTCAPAVRMHTCAAAHIAHAATCCSKEHVRSMLFEDMCLVFWVSSWPYLPVGMLHYRGTCETHVFLHWSCAAHRLMRSKLASLSPPLGHVYDRAQKREGRGMFCIHYAVRMSNIATGHRTQGLIALWVTRHHMSTKLRSGCKQCCVTFFVMSIFCMTRFHAWHNTVCR